MLDVEHTCVNVGICSHIWVVVNLGIGGPLVRLAMDRYAERACPRCFHDRSVWYWDTIVGGDPKKRGA